MLVFFILLIFSIHNSIPTNFLTRGDINRIQNILNSHMTHFDLINSFNSIQAFNTEIIKGDPLKLDPRELGSLNHSPLSVLILTTFANYTNNNQLTKDIDYASVMGKAINSSDPSEIVTVVESFTMMGLPLPDAELLKLLTRIAPTLTKPKQLVPALLLCSYLFDGQSLARDFYSEAIKGLAFIEGNLQFVSDYSLTAKFLQGIYRNPSLTFTQGMVNSVLGYVLSARYSESPSVLASLIQAVAEIARAQERRTLGLVTVGMKSNSLTVMVTDILGGPVTADFVIDCGVDKMSQFVPIGDQLYEGRITGSLPFGRVPYKCSIKMSGNSTYFDNFDHVDYFYNTVSVDFDYVDLVVDSVKLEEQRTASVRDSLSLKFAVKSLNPQQVFVQFSADNGLEITYLVDYLTSPNSYVFKLDFSDASKHFGGNSGTYRLSLVVGDSKIESFRREIGKVQFEFEGNRLYNPRARFEPKELKYHTFKEPHKQPPRVVSLTFSGAVIVLFVILLISWIWIGGKVMIYPSITLFGFYFLFGGILGLYVMYWTCLNMFETLKYLGLLVVPTVYCGSRVLRTLATKRKAN